MVIAAPDHWKEAFYDTGPKYDKIVEIIDAINDITDYTTDLTAYFKVTGRTNEDLTFTGTGKIASTDGDYTHTLGKANIGYVGYGNYAGFKHRSVASNGYAILQQNTGTTLINCATGTLIYFRRANETIAELNGLDFDVGATARSIALQTEYVLGGHSSRLYHRETNDNQFGFSWIYAGTANPTLGGTAFTLTTNQYYLIRHNGSTVGNIVLEFPRGSGNIKFHSGIELQSALDLDCYTNGAYFKPRRVSQSAIPTPDANELMVWRDSDDNKTYLVYNDTDEGVRSVEMI